MSYDKESGIYTGYIYCITNTINGKQYVGQTSRTIMLRWKQHKNCAAGKQDNQYLHNAMRTYGIENFKVEEISRVTSDLLSKLHCLLDLEESKLISIYNSIVPNGYNITSGGDVNPTIVTCKPVLQLDYQYNVMNEFQSISEASQKTGLGYDIISCSCKKYRILSKYGCIYCFKNNFDYIVENKPFSTSCISTNKKRKTIVQYDLGGEILYKYNSVADAVIGCGLKSSDGIYDVLNGKRAMAGGYLWSYEGHLPKKYEKPVRNVNKNRKKNSYSKKIPICMYSKSGDFIRRYDSYKDTEKDGFNKKTVYECCKHHLNQTGGYVFEYEGISPRTGIKRKRIESNYSPVLQYDLAGNFISKYESIKEASKISNGCESRISSCCRGQSHSSGGYLWRYATKNDSDKMSISPYVKKSRKSFEIYIVDLNGNIISKFSNTGEAIKYTKLSKGTFYRCLNGERTYKPGIFIKRERDIDICDELSKCS